MSEIAGKSQVQERGRAGVLDVSCFFQRLRLKTGSNVTAHTTTQSRKNGDFPKGDPLVSAEWRLRSAASLFYSGNESSAFVFRLIGSRIAAGSMPSERYYKQQATALLSWARATHDKAWAQILRQRAARALQRAEESGASVTDLNPLLEEFNETQMRKKPPPVQHVPMQQQPIQQPMQQQQSKATERDKDE